jgi:hypothetical protein
VAESQNNCNSLATSNGLSIYQFGFWVSVHGPQVQYIRASADCIRTRRANVPLRLWSATHIASSRTGVYHRLRHQLPLQPYRQDHRLLVMVLPHHLPSKKA